MPKQLSSLFVTILVFREPAKPNELWLKYSKVMGEDVAREAITTYGLMTDALMRRTENTTLLMLQDEIAQMDKSLEEFGLPSPMNQKLSRNTHVSSKMNCMKHTAKWP